MRSASGAARQPTERTGGRLGGRRGEGFARLMKGSRPSSDSTAAAAAAAAVRERDEST